jgi:hypothetical protein
MIVTGIAMFVFGYTDIPSKPRTAGVLTLWGSFSTIGDKPIIVGGKTILANYFPFNLSCEQIDITNVDKKIPMAITSKDEVVLEGNVSITLFPDLEDAIDYIQAGGDIKKIIEQLDDIVKKGAREIARNIDALEITQDSEKLSGPLKAGVEKYVDSKSFGVTVYKIQAIFNQPDDVIKAMKGVRLELYERKNEMTEYTTFTQAARQLQEFYQSDPLMEGKVPTLKECVEEIKSLRLIRDSRSQEVRNKDGKSILVNQTGKT